MPQLPHSHTFLSSHQAIVQIQVLRVHLSTKKKFSCTSSNLHNSCLLYSIQILLLELNLQYYVSDGTKLGLLTTALTADRCYGNPSKALSIFKAGG